MEIDIVVINEVELMLNQFDLIKQLNPNLTLENYKQMLNEMIRHDYKQVVCLLNDKPIAVSGYWINTKIYCGKYIELDNFVVDENYRGEKIGAKLCAFLLDIAKQENCKVAMLDAYLENSRGHNFYESIGFQKKGFHFIKKLN